MPENATQPGTETDGKRSPTVWVYLCPECGGYPPCEDRWGGLLGPCDGCGAWDRALRHLPAIAGSTRPCGSQGSHKRATGGLGASGSGKRTEVQWAVCYGGDDPEECAGVMGQDDEASATAMCQWIVGGYVARRTVAYGHWERAEGGASGA